MRFVQWLRRERLKIPQKRIKWTLRIVYLADTKINLHDCGFNSFFSDSSRQKTFHKTKTRLKKWLKKLSLQLWQTHCYFTQSRVKVKILSAVVALRPSAGPTLLNAPCSSRWAFGPLMGRPRQTGEPHRVWARVPPHSLWGRDRFLFLNKLLNFCRKENVKHRIGLTILKTLFLFLKNANKITDISSNWNCSWKLSAQNK